MKETNEHYSALPVLSYNAIFNMIITNRNYGKTWSFKKRAFIRGLKRGKKTLWLRTFKKEAQEAAASFYSSRDLQDYCGIIPFDKETNEGNFKQIGNTFYCLHNGKWTWFLKIARVGDANAVRSCDDVELDTIVYDEFTTTSEHEKRYRGNRVNDFIDIFFSVKREHSVRCFFLGNKENVINPFLSYFGIKPLASTWQGIKTFKNGSLAVQQVNNLPSQERDFERHVKDLFQGTLYGNYIYESKYKNEHSFKTHRNPPNSHEYIQLYINDFAIKISVLNGFFYVSNSIDTLRRVYTLQLLHKFKDECLLIKKQKRFFIAFVNAIADNRVYYDSITTYEAIQPFMQWLSI